MIWGIWIVFLEREHEGSVRGMQQTQNLSINHNVSHFTTGLVWGRLDWAGVDWIGLGEH